MKVFEGKKPRSSLYTEQETYIHDAAGSPLTSRSPKSVFRFPASRQDIKWNVGIQIKKSCLHVKQTLYELNNCTNWSLANSFKMIRKKNGARATPGISWWRLGFPRRHILFIIFGNTCQPFRTPLLRNEHRNSYASVFF